MNVIITIGSDSITTNEHYESWIPEQIRNRRDAGQPVSVEVKITGDIDLTFVCHDTPTGGGGGSRNYTPRQQEIINLWQKHKLTECPFELDSLISFLKKLDKRLN